MKIKSLSFKFFESVALAAITIITLWGVSTRPAQAYTITLTQVGPVGQTGPVIEGVGSGAIDLTGLTFAGSITPVEFDIPVVAPGSGIILTGRPLPTGTLVDAYTGFTGPTSFGPGGFINPDSAGAFVGIIRGADGFGPLGALFVPHGYVSGTPL